MIDPLSRTQITYSEQFADSGSDPDLPPGFVSFHTQNFCNYFQLTPCEFQGKSVLETGAGPGKHAAVLHLLGAHVTAVDLLDSNVEAIERLKVEHNFTTLVAHRADLMQPLPDKWTKFDLISAHNWIQHAENPGKVLENLLDKLKEGGRLYLSVYQAGTFRFFVDRIARSVLRWHDREAAKSLTPLFFPVGFLEFENADDIYFENIFDDYFVPYMWTFRYESLIRFFRERGCEVLTPHADQSRLYEIDNEPLKVSFIKGSDITKEVEPNEIACQVDEFDLSHIDASGDRELIRDSVGWALKAIDSLQATADHDSYIRAAFCLGLYRLRATFCRDKNAHDRHVALRDFLKRFVIGDVRSIGAWESSRSYYAQEST